MDKSDRSDYRYRLKKISPNLSINLSLTSMRINKNNVHPLKTKHDTSFRNDSLSKEVQKRFIEINNNSSMQSDNITERHNHQTTSKNMNTLSHIRKTFLNINNNKEHNSDDDTSVKNQEKIMNLTSFDQDFRKSIKQHKIIPSTLPKAMIDISKNESIANNGVNITYNNDDIVNIHLKLKKKNTVMTKELLTELQLLNKEIENVIDRYKTCNTIQ